MIFKTGAYHPPAESGEAAHHAHSHDPAPQLGEDVEHVGHDNHDTHAVSASNAQTTHDRSAHNDHAHGTAAHDHAEPAKPEAHGQHDHSAVYPDTSSQPHLQHSAKLMVGDGETDPIHFAEVNHPVSVDGEVQYVIRLRLDQSERFEIYQAAVSTLSIILASIVLLAVGIPALLALRSRKQAELADQQVHFLARHDH